MPAYSHLLHEESDQFAIMKAAGRSICAILQNTTANPLKDAERRQFDEANSWDKP
jgi:hypothetical protein